MAQRMRVFALLEEVQGEGIEQSGEVIVSTVGRTFGVM